MKSPTLSKTFMDVIKTESTELAHLPEPKIYGVRISQDANGCFCISVRHTGPFRLMDYELLDFETKSVRLVKKK